MFGKQIASGGEELPQLYADWPDVTEERDNCGRTKFARIDDIARRGNKSEGSGEILRAVPH